MEDKNNEIKKRENQNNEYKIKQKNKKLTNKIPFITKKQKQKK